MEEGEVGGKTSWSNQYPYFQESGERKWDRKKEEKNLDDCAQG